MKYGTWFLNIYNRGMLIKVQFCFHFIYYALSAVFCLLGLSLPVHLYGKVVFTWSVYGLDIFFFYFRVGALFN